MLLGIGWQISFPCIHRSFTKEWISGPAGQFRHLKLYLLGVDMRMISSSSRCFVWKVFWRLVKIFVQLHPQYCYPALCHYLSTCTHLIDTLLPVQLFTDWNLWIFKTLNTRWHIQLFLEVFFNALVLFFLIWIPVMMKFWCKIKHINLAILFVAFIFLHIENNINTRFGIIKPYVGNKKVTFWNSFLFIVKTREWR